MATRIERTKFLARNESELATDVEFSTWEIQATLLLKKRTDPGALTLLPKRLSISLLTKWIAELGGYTGKSSHGSPEGITIKRGLELILPVAEGLEQMHRDSYL